MKGFICIVIGVAMVIALPFLYTPLPVLGSCAYSFEENFSHNWWVYVYVLVQSLFIYVGIRLELVICKNGKVPD